jgi:hypothetical protein
MCDPVQRSRAAFAYSRLSLRILIFEERRKAADKHYAKHDVVRSLQDKRREQFSSDHAQDE